MNAAILSVMHNLRRQPSICSSNVLAVEEYIKFYLVARFDVFQRFIPLFKLREGGTSLYYRSHFNNTCAFCWEDGGVMCEKHLLANHLLVNNAYKCTIDRDVPVNSHCVHLKDYDICIKRIFFVHMSITVCHTWEYDHNTMITSGF